MALRRRKEEARKLYVKNGESELRLLTPAPTHRGPHHYISNELYRTNMPAGKLAYEDATRNIIQALRPLRYPRYQAIRLMEIPDQSHPEVPVYLFLNLNFNMMKGEYSCGYALTGFCEVKKKVMAAPINERAALDVWLQRNNPEYRALREQTLPKEKRQPVLKRKRIIKNILKVAGIDQRVSVSGVQYFDKHRSDILLEFSALLNEQLIEHLEFVDQIKRTEGLR